MKRTSATAVSDAGGKRQSDDLPPPVTVIPDKEVERREEELLSGKVVAITHEKFVRRVEEARRR